MAENDESEERWQWHYPRIARLYEAAELNQENIAKVIEELKQTRTALPATVARDVNQKLETSFANAKHQLDEAANKAGDRIVQKFENANANADKATAAYERAANFAIWLPAAIILLAVIGGIAVAAWFILPDAETVHAVRMEEARLRANIEEWRRMEGADVLSYCKEGSEMRRCVRTDESSEKEPFVDRGQTYRIIYGY